MERLPADSTTQGPPPNDEQLGALTLGGFFSEVCEAYAEREAPDLGAESELTLTGSNKVQKGPLRDLAIRYLAQT